jgi:hypothetical protein
MGVNCEGGDMGIGSLARGYETARLGVVGSCVEAKIAVLMQVLSIEQGYFCPKILIGVSYLLGEERWLWGG